MKSNFEKLNKNFEIELENKNPTEYCNLYYSLNPNKKEEADKMYLECRCKYIKNKFDLDFINGKVNGCYCRDDEYRKSGKLFADKTEFNMFYDKGNNILLEEIAIRDFKTQASIIETLNLKDINNNEVSGREVGKAILGEVTGLNIPENSEKEKLTKSYVQKIASYKDKPYYSKIMDFIIETNKGLNKEWTKNGVIFYNKVEFYEAYISGNYKQILKAKKH